MPNDTLPEYIEELMEIYNVSQVPALAIHENYDIETKTVLAKPNYESNTHFTMPDLKRYLNRYARPDKVDGDELLSLLSEMKMNPRPVLYKEYIDKTLNIESIPRNSSHLIYFTTLNSEKDVLTEFNQINQLARFLWNIIEISVVRLDD